MRGKDGAAEVFPCHEDVGSDEKRQEDWEKNKSESGWVSHGEKSSYVALWECESVGLVCEWIPIYKSILMAKKMDYDFGR